VFIAFVRNKKLLVPIVAIVLLVLAFGSPYVQDRISGIFDVDHPENASRIMLWKTGLRMVADHPLFGIGDIDMHELYLQYMDPGDPAQHGHFHSMMIQFLVTLGIAGFVAVCAMFVKIFMVEWNIFRRVKHEWFAGSVALGSLAVFVGFQVNGLTEWSFGDQEVVLLLWTSLGMALALGNFHQGAKDRNS
jgi:O-antigen ligase